MEATDPDRLRIATWNIRYFPYSSLSVPSNPNELTNLAWLACALAWVNADIVAIQEIRTTRDAQDALESVLDGLNGLTGEVWDSDLQSCGGGFSQHVGHIWNTARVRLSRTQDLWQLNGRARNESQPCAGNLRPGRYAFAKAEVDFHIVSVHSDSGREARYRANRQAALERVEEALAPYIEMDHDVIILGDFNTMGQDGFETATEERERLASTVAQETPGFRALPAEPGCSAYYHGSAGLLDLVLVEDDMSEAGINSARVTGYCALANCDRIEGRMPLAYERLSDHCPVIVSVTNRDLD